MGAPQQQQEQQGFFSRPDIGGANPETLQRELEEANKKVQESKAADFNIGALKSNIKLITSFKDYQDAALETAIYPGSGGVLGLAYCALGLGEVGEVQGKIKKVIRDSNGNVTEETKKELGKEIGDILWYCAALSKELGLNLSDIATENIQKLQSRQQRGVLTGSGDNR